MSSEFEIVELDDIDKRPAFFTERTWATDKIGEFERGEVELPPGYYPQGACVCRDPVAIVRRRPQ